MTISLENMVRGRDHETSWLAAQSITAADLNAGESEILRLLSNDLVADHELVKLYARQARRSAAVPKLTPQRIRTLRHYLTLVGLVEFAGCYHFTDFGRKAMVWRASSTG